MEPSKPRQVRAGEGRICPGRVGYGGLTWEDKLALHEFDGFNSLPQGYCVMIFFFSYQKVNGRPTLIELRTEE